MQSNLYISITQSQVFWNTPNDLIRMSLWAADRESGLTYSWRWPWRGACLAAPHRCWWCIQIPPLDAAWFLWYPETRLRSWDRLWRQKTRGWLNTGAVAHNVIRECNWVGRCSRSSSIVPDCHVKQKKAWGHGSRNHGNASPYSSCSGHSLSEPTFGQCTTRDGPAGVTGCWMSCPGVQWWHRNSVIFNHYTTSSNITKPFNHF